MDDLIDDEGQEALVGGGGLAWLRPRSAAVFTPPAHVLQ